MQRKAGVVLPLFSLRTTRDWGIGQLTDLPLCASWLAGAGQRLMQILPPHQLSAGETSPYGALTAFGIDPIYVDVDAVLDLNASAIAEALGDGGKRILTEVRQSARVQYKEVRALKERALRLAFDRFHAREWTAGSARAQALSDFITRERSWLDDLALYIALREAHGGGGWQTWPDGERMRSAPAMADARVKHARRILEVGYVQWIALQQWGAAQARMHEMGVDLMGDLPFVVCAESADVWSHASQFQLQLSLGAPPDAYSAEGQDWGLPPYDWSVMEKDNLSFVRSRVRHAASLYDRFRLDHVVGYFRQWVRAPGGESRGHFEPEDEKAQRSRGAGALEAVLDELSRAKGVDPPRAMGEDLGVIPPFVRETMKRLDMPGYRVLPWEKDDWEKDGGTLRDPRSFPPRSIATWSTHDTAPIVAWWDDLSERDRAVLSERAGLAASMNDAERSLSLLRYLFAAGSELTLVLAQELIAVRDRINTPDTVGPHNWTWRLPKPVEELRADPRVVARFEAIRSLVDASGRSP
jgi:4-alpha-glucanotransferase